MADKTMEGSTERSRPRVFVVHGHDMEAVNGLELLLRRIGAEPVILFDEPVAGSSTIIERLEQLLPTVDAVVCLLTPDDEGRRRGSKDKMERRARQNVLIEAGFAVISKRSKSILVSLGRVAIPTDFDGIIRITDDVWSPETDRQVANRLEDLGLEIDLRRVTPLRRRVTPGGAVQVRRRTPWPDNNPGSGD